jgi:peptide/nickel transport system permease protein
MAALTVSQVPHLTRIVRSITLTVVESEYIAAAWDAGAGHYRILYRHVMPNILGPVIVQTALSMAGMILLGAGLSFIGLGPQPPAPEWGAMLFSAREFLRRAPHLAIFPGACILVSALCFNLLGDSLRDALDPGFGSGTAD